MLDAYRYGFNGKENDNEIKGEGNYLDYGFRVYDPRLGKFLSVDPLFQSFAYYTPYQFGKSNPLIFIDPDGKDEFYFNSDGSWSVKITDGDHKFFEQSGEGYKEMQILDRQWTEWLWATIGLADVSTLADYFEDHPEALEHLNQRRTTVENAKLANTYSLWNGYLKKPLEYAEYATIVYGGVRYAIKKGAQYTIKKSAKEGSKRILVKSKGVWKDVTDLPKQVHHFLSNKHLTKYTKTYEKIVKKYGLDLDGEWNKELLHHLGRHPEKYHEMVLKGTQKAMKEAGDDVNKFLKFFEKYVKKPIRENPGLLRKEHKIVD